MNGVRHGLACLAIAGLVVVGAGSAALSGNATAALSGRYGRHFINGDMDGNVGGSDDVVEIVPAGDGAAYVRVELQFYNGHQCSIAGIGAVEGGRIVYDDRAAFQPGDPPCVLTVSRKGNSLLLDDADGSCKAYCGARGSLSRATLPFASRRPIRYLARLKASREFTDALQAWKARPGG